MYSADHIVTVGDRIVEARKLKEMTQLDLSKLLGISRAAVGQWEINSTSPSITKLEEVAMLLGVEPEWLAYGVRSGEPKIVYRNPERDNIIWIEEITFGADSTDVIKGDRWGIPAEYISRELRAPVGNTVLATINSHAVEVDYEYGDKVFVDMSDVRPSPAGVFLFWDGIGPAYARLQAIPGGEPKVRITQKGADTLEVPLDSVRIIGRVKGRIQRG